MLAEIACWTVATAAKRAARRCSSVTSSVVNELHRHWTRDHTASHAFIQEQPNGGAPARAVVERPVIDVHPDERIRFAAVQPAGKAHGMIERFGAVIQSVRNAVPEMTRDLFLHLARHVFPDDIAAQRQRQSGL